MNKVKRRIIALYLGDNIIRYTVENKFRWWQKWHFMMDGKYPRLFNREELELFGFLKNNKSKNDNKRYKEYPGINDD